MNEHASARDRPLVAMMVANTVRVDGRVQKAAAAVASFGYDVELLGIAPAKRKLHGTVGDAKLTLLPVHYTLRDAGHRFGEKSLVRRLGSLLGAGTEDQYTLNARRIKVRQRELEARRGRRRSGLTAPRRGQLAADNLARTALSARARLLGAVWNVTGDDLQTRRKHGWRRSLPEMHDFELAFGTELDRLQPDVIHAHDVHLLGIATRARDRAVLQGRRPTVVYDSHEYVPGLASVAKWKIDAFVEIEEEYIETVDRIITVSPLLAEWLERDHEPEHPVSVVMNAPIRAWDSETDPVPSLRAAAGLDSSVPVIVYSGGINRTRGVGTLIEALPHMPECHLVMVTILPHRMVTELFRRAEALGVRDRVHTAPFVQPHQISRYLSEADVGIHPMLHAPNHEVALPNKYFEYLHAGLPIVVSDVQLMSETTHRTGVGECFTAGDPEECAATVRKVLADRDRYVSNITDEILDEYSWEHQAETLRGLYGDLGLSRPPSNAPIRTDVAVAGIDFEDAPAIPAGTTKLLIGPTNAAGQSDRWARALQAEAEIGATSMALVRPEQLQFDADVKVPLDSWGDDGWQKEQLERVRTEFSHVLLTSGRAILGTRNGGLFAHDLDQLTSMGKKAAVVFHGSEIRNPARHAATEVDSPFSDPTIPLVEQLQGSADRLQSLLTGQDIPAFVTTVDLLDDVPDATWLPPVIDPREYSATRPPRFDRKPVVLHAPSNSLLKGSANVDEICRRLESEGLIEYARVEGVEPSKMPGVICGADIVLDQFGIGHYGVMSIQAMSAGRVVVAHVSDSSMSRLPGVPPIIRSTARDLETSLRAIVADASTAITTAKKGPEYVRTFHDGRLAAAQLAAWITTGSPVSMAALPELADQLNA